MIFPMEFLPFPSLDQQEQFAFSFFCSCWFLFDVLEWSMHIGFGIIVDEKKK